MGCSNCSPLYHTIHSTPHPHPPPNPLDIRTEFLEVDCSLGVSLCDSISMTQFPTSVFYFQGGYYPFNLFHTKKDISEFIRSYSEKRSVGFNLRDFNTEYSRALKKSDNVIIFVGDEGSPELEIYSTHLRRFHENRSHHSTWSVGD